MIQSINVIFPFSSKNLEKIVVYVMPYLKCQPNLKLIIFKLSNCSDSFLLPLGFTNFGKKTKICEIRLGGKNEINGFCKQVLQELPMEFAVEAQKLVSISLEGSVG